MISNYFFFLFKILMYLRFLKACMTILIKISLEAYLLLSKRSLKSPLSLTYRRYSKTCFCFFPYYNFNTNLDYNAIVQTSFLFFLFSILIVFRGFLYIKMTFCQTFYNHFIRLYSFKL